MRKSTDTTSSKFEIALSKELLEFGKNCEYAMQKAVREGMKVGLEEVKKNTLKQGLYRKERNYYKGWSKDVKYTKGEVKGVIYNKVAGLPHLLEKGHASMDGGFVKGYPHIAPAAERAFQTTTEILEKYFHE